MGKLTVGGADRADFINEGSRSTAGATAWFAVRAQANLTLFGNFVGEVVVERSFDGGTTALVCTALGQPVVFTGPASEGIEESEAGVLYRINFRVRTSGTLNWRVSR